MTFSNRPSPDPDSDDDFCERYLRPAAEQMRRDAIAGIGQERHDAREYAERIWREAIDSIRFNFSGRTYDYDFTRSDQH